MAMTDPNGGAFIRAMVTEMEGLQEDLNRDWAKMLEYYQGHPVPPPTRRQKIKRRVWWWQHDLRSRIGRFVAPWLDDY